MRVFIIEIIRIFGSNIIENNINAVPGLESMRDSNIFKIYCCVNDAMSTFALFTALPAVFENMQ